MRKRFERKATGNNDDSAIEKKTAQKNMRSKKMSKKTKQKNLPLKGK
jgi:hypothetical protein